MKTARIKKETRPHGGRLVTVVREHTHNNGRQVVHLILGRHEVDMSHWTQKFGRLSHNVLEYGPHELTAADGSAYVFGKTEPTAKERLCRLMSLKDVGALLA